MPNPIEVERAFQHTLSEIGSAPSYRLVYHLFWEFTESLDGKYETYDSYLLQLMDELPRFSNPLTWSGIGPGLLQKYGHRLETIQKRLQTESADETIRRLHEVTFFQFVCLNDTDGAETIYKKLFGSGFPQDMEKNFSTSVQDNFRLIVSKLEAGPELFKDKKQKKSARSLIQDFRFVLHQEKQRALVPVVEKYGNREREAYQTGRLRMLTVMIDQQGTDADRLARRFNVYGAETASYIEKESIAGAARELAKKTDVYLADTFCKGSVEYTVNSISHDGDSANAAISILWFTALLSTSGGRIRYSLKPNVVITGDINKAGNILPIDKKSIEWKAKAAFFSWADVLAVPASQRKNFENAIRELEEQYPTRKLSLIGIGNLEEMLFDRRISNHDVISKTRHVARQLKREKFKTVSIPTILILLLIIARLVYGPVDRNVVDIDISGSQLLLKNAIGSTVKEITLDKSTSDYLNIRSNFFNHPLTVLTDINQDGNNELIYASRANFEVDDSPRVMAWSVSWGFTNLAGRYLF